MKQLNWPRILSGYVAALLLVTVWGAIVQAQYNIAGLNSVGADIPPGLRLGTTLRDIFSGFSPTYGGYVVAPSLAVAFAVAWKVAGSARETAALVWFGLAGGLAIAAGIPLVNFLSPVALLIGATRDLSCTILMALGGVFGGLLFAKTAFLVHYDTRMPPPAMAAS